MVVNPYDAPRIQQFQGGLNPQAEKEMSKSCIKRSSLYLLELPEGNRAFKNIYLAMLIVIGHNRSVPLFQTFTERNAEWLKQRLQIERAAYPDIPKAQKIPTFIDPVITPLDARPRQIWVVHLLPRESTCKLSVPQRE